MSLVTLMLLTRILFQSRKFLGPALYLHLLTLGCSSDPNTSTTSRSLHPINTSSREQPESHLPTRIASATAEARILNCSDFLSWYTLREKHRLHDPQFNSLDPLFRKQEMKLRAESPAKPFNQFIDLVYFSWVEQPRKLNRENVYRVTWILYVNSPVTHTYDSVNLVFQAFADPRHSHLLGSEFGRETGCVQLSIPDVHLNELVPNEYYKFSSTVFAPSIPYRMFTSLIGKRGEYIHETFGSRISLGLYIDLAQ